MGGVARSELVAAVGAAGGFGFLGMVREPVSLLESEVARLRSAGHTCFGINLIPAATDATLLKEQIAACIALKVPAICLFWDLDAALVRQLRDAGVLVVYQVGSAAEAAAAERAGVQIIIAQGVEAGGHVRGRQKLVELLPEVVAATSVPVLAAGGMARGADVATAMALGADGAVLGTVMIATSEAYAHDYHKQRLLAASARDTVLTEAFHVNWPAGAAVRVLESEVTAGRRGDPAKPNRTAIGMEQDRPIYLYSTDSPLRSTIGSFEDMALYAGMGVGYVLEVMSAGERLVAIAEDAETLIAEPGESVVLPESSSPVCYAGTIGAEYMGLLGREELLERLNELLETVRAELVIELATADDDSRGMEPHIRLVRWAVRLARLLVSLEGEVSRSNMGSPVEDGAGPQTVNATLRSLLPLVADDCVREPLEAMLKDFPDLPPSGGSVRALVKG
jgi:nitronate monooxygenase